MIRHLRAEFNCIETLGSDINKKRKEKKETLGSEAQTLEIVQSPNFNQIYTKPSNLQNQVDKMIG